MGYKGKDNAAENKPVVWTHPKSLPIPTEMRRDKEGLLLIGKYFAKSHSFLVRPQFGLIGKGPGDGLVLYHSAAECSSRLPNFSTL